MDADGVVRLRLSRQQLRGPHADAPAMAVKNLLAVQAQEFQYARWSLAQRTTSATAAEVEQAVADGRILPTHILRPTWHFVHRDDLRWLMSLSGPRLHQGNRGMYRRTGIDTEVAEKGNTVLAAAGTGGNHLTRDELATELQRAGFLAKGLELAYLIMNAEIGGVLVPGAPVRSAGGPQADLCTVRRARPRRAGCTEVPGRVACRTGAAVLCQPWSCHHQGLRGLVRPDHGGYPIGSKADP